MSGIDEDAPRSSANDIDSHDAQVPGGSEDSKTIQTHWPKLQEVLDPGTLYLVSTPIGHLGDISLRALSVLESADVVLAEDTRHSKRLLNRYGIKPKKLVPLHEHNEQQQAEHWAKQLSAGMTLALISDAGTPLVSDPGYLLVQAAITHGATVSPVPGPCAFVAALCISGLPSHDARFLGFLPAKQGARRSRLQSLQGQSGVIGFYEAPHRLQASLEDMVSIFGESHLCVLAHDLTKRYESVIRGSLGSCLAAIRQSTPRGEWVVWLGPAPNEQATPWPAEATQLLLSIREHLPAKAAAGIVAEHYGLNKKACYNWLLAYKHRSTDD